MINIRIRPHHCIILILGVFQLRFVLWPIACRQPIHSQDLVTYGVSSHICTEQHALSSALKYQGSGQHYLMLDSISDTSTHGSLNHVKLMHNAKKWVSLVLFADCPQLLPFLFIPEIFKQTVCPLCNYTDQSQPTKCHRREADAFGQIYPTLKGCHNVKVRYQNYARIYFG